MTIYYGDLQDANGNTILPTASAVKSFNRPELLYASADVKSITPQTGSNYTNFGGCYYYKIGTTVHLHLGLQSLTSNIGNLICTMPTGYRPRSMITVVGGGSTSTAIIQTQITANGVLTVYPGTSTYACADIIFDAFS